ncbi:MAG: glycine cleavage system protein T [Flavobacteriales bacterium]|nr:glycine cleavage system protein T [Flavobacteriales bacterium]|tara:strand:- start:16140 stop:17228 length:1089 start_codon:yes stop_codon:yes gene_type:complete
MKKLALSDIHENLGGKMVDFAGFYMPVQYEGVKVEHVNVRENVGVFDVSHMGEFVVAGEEAEAFIQKTTSNDVTLLEDGQVQYSCIPNDEGGIVDDLLIYRFSKNKYFLVVNASNIEKDWDWLNSKNDTLATLQNVSNEWSLFAVQGPNSTKVLSKLTELDIDSMKYYTYKKGDFAGVQGVLISATGYTGAGGFEIYVKNENAVKVWEAIMQAGYSEGIKPTGLAARDTLRLEMGYALYGNDIDDTTSPLEAKLGWITKLETEFSSVDFLRKQKELGVTKRLVAFTLIERGIPRKDYQIFSKEGTLIGRVTSGTMSPTLGKAIGMGYVAKEYSKVDTEIYISIREKKIKSKVVRLPFVSPNV